MAKDGGVLFVDISGTTRLFRRSGGGEGQYQLERCIRRMERSIEGNGGKLLTSEADELSATFPRADDAVLAAIDMQRRIEDLPPVAGVRLSIRIAVCAGKLDAAAAGLSEDASRTARVLLGLAGVGQIVTSAGAASSLGRAQRDLLQSLDGLVLPAGLGGHAVYQVLWRPEAVRQEGLPAAVPKAANKENVIKLRHPETNQLTLRWAGKALLVDNRTPKISIGRDKACAIALKGNKASRLHAVIARQADGSFTLTDDSTNGTFLFVEGLGETRVHLATARITGHGRIAFGHPTQEAGGEVIEFEVA